MISKKILCVLFIFIFLFSFQYIYSLETNENKNIYLEESIKEENIINNTMSYKRDVFVRDNRRIIIMK